MPVNAFSRAKLKLADGENVELQVWTDSTGNGATAPREWPYLFADWLAAQYPASPVVLVPYDSINNVYGSAITISAGTGGPSITICNFAVPGATAQYGLGNLWTRALRMRQPDCTIASLGLNHVTGKTDPVVLGELVAGIETYRLAHPETPLVIVKQNPFQNTNGMDSAYRSIDRMARLRDFTICDPAAAFIAAGKPTSLYLSGDATHPSQTGQQLYCDAITAVWSDAQTADVRPSPSVFAAPIADDLNLIRNGNFCNWGGSVPDAWNAGGAGTLTVAKDTTIVADMRRGYSLKMTAVNNYTHLYQDVHSDILSMQRGKELTFAAKRYVDQAGASGQGRIYILSSSPTLGTVTEQSAGYVTQQNGWVWWAISGFVVPTDATLVRVGLYHDTGASPSAYPVYFDQATLFPGILPRSL